MIKKILIIVCVIALGANCTRESDGQNIIFQKDYHPLYGKWKLSKIEGGFHPDRIYNGEVIWNILGGELQPNQIEVSVLNDAYYPLMSPDSTGRYAYEIYGDTIELSNNDNGMIEKLLYTINSTSLIIDGNLSADGYRFTFIRE